MSPIEKISASPTLAHRAPHVDEARPELADSWFGRVPLFRAPMSSRPPRPDAIDDPVADAWFV